MDNLLTVLENQSLVQRKKGMDISEYQGTINWDTVKNRSDIDFVIIRCSYGSGYKDRKWEYNVKRM